VAEETPDLDRLLARLSEQRQNPGDVDDHLSAEKLSAYQAGELPPEENDAIQEHLAHCTLCTGMLLDLQRFLEPPPEDLPREGVVDFAAEAEWRSLREKLREAQAQNAAAKRGLFRRISWMPAVAAVMAILLVGAAYRIVVLQRELARPTAVQITTVEEQGSKKGAPGVAEPSPVRLGNVAIFDTHSERPYPNYRLSFRDKDGRIQATVEAQEDENGMIALRLPKGFLTPGLYHIQVLGLEGATANPIREFDIRILH
jgi:hypothetical protein